LRHEYYDAWEKERTATCSPTRRDDAASTKEAKHRWRRRRKDLAQHHGEQADRYDENDPKRTLESMLRLRPALRRYGA